MVCQCTEKLALKEWEVGMYVYMYVCIYVCTVEPQSYEPPSVHKSEMSVTLKSSTSLKNCVVLYNFHEEKCSCYDLYRALTIANTELDFCKI